MQRNIYVPNKVDKLNFIILYSNYSAKNTRFPVFKYKNENYINHHANLIRKRFSREKDIEIYCVYGNNEKQVAASLPNEAISVFNEKYNETGDARSICLALYNMAATNCFIIDGRFGWTENILDNIRLQDLQNSFVLLGNKCDNIIGSVVTNNKPEILMHGSKNRFSGISFINGKSMGMLRSIVSDPDNNKLLSFEILNKLIEKNKDFYAIVDDTIGTELCL